jgi:hypothetical protein
MTRMPRSSVPMVMGVLMIVFASIGLVVTAVNLYASTRDHMVAMFPTAAKLTVMLGILEAIVGIMQLGAGIACVRYRRSGPERAISYGIARIVLTLGNFVATFMLVKPELGAVAPPLSALYTTGAALTITWAIVVIALMSREAAKASCTI